MLHLGSRPSAPQVQAQDLFNKASKVADVLTNQDYLCERNGKYYSTGDELKYTESQSFPPLLMRDCHGSQADYRDALEKVEEDRTWEFPTTIAEDPVRQEEADMRVAIPDVLSCYENIKRRDPIPGSADFEHFRETHDRLQRYHSQPGKEKESNRSFVGRLKNHRSETVRAVAKTLDLFVKIVDEVTRRALAGRETKVEGSGLSSDREQVRIPEAHSLKPAPHKTCEAMDEYFRICKNREIFLSTPELRKKTSELFHPPLLWRTHRGDKDKYREAMKSFEKRDRPEASTSDELAANSEAILLSARSAILEDYKVIAFKSPDSPHFKEAHENVRMTVKNASQILNLAEKRELEVIGLAGKINAFAKDLLRHADSLAGVDAKCFT
jgi:hypothetical protein